MKLTREQLRIELYGGEDYRIYDGTRLVATVYAHADLEWLFDRDAALREELAQAQAENARLNAMVKFAREELMRHGLGNLAEREGI